MNLDNDLQRLVSLICEIETMIDRPFNRGSVGEFIASRVFDIELEVPGHKGSDGRFRSGPYKSKSVNVKWYIKQGINLILTPTTSRFLLSAYRIEERSSPEDRN